MANFRNIVKKFIPTNLFRRVEPIGHMAEAVVANVKYGFPSHGMHMIGVTGTNGKTTTTFFIKKMLHEAGFPVAMLSTVAFGIGDDIHPQIAHITTAQSGILQKRLSDFKKAGVQWVVLESSSHSLAQHRIWGVPYEIAVMTNVTSDHLDYHGTFDRYLDAKVRLFKVANKHGRKFGVVNADDPNAGRFVDSISRSITYGVNAGELRAKNVFLAADHSTFQVEVEKETYNIHVNIPGEFNVSNALAAIAVGREIGLSKDQIEQGIAALTSVEGRMTVVSVGQKFNVIVDFASTPDAFEQFFVSVRPAVKGKLIAVFGSAGRRDEAKRAVQGEIAGKYSDEVIVTEEDDRDVDGNQILDQIASGAQKSGKVVDKNLFQILDRESAIRFALTRAKNAEDTVVLLGKGHEKTIERADGVHPWNEIEITRKLLQDLIKNS
ncbi:MAG TPA: UDP-N-acetylmuramoyl-L-alanyl-D-glutamate--2,6-diaminopimelate ligase [Candidatus Saccharimonadales bacterium]|nr:UDP-N-acetylmuramoyl-L-alanyl-D-glutamate--2,6-diaminopimelate ligase [Candidatus Saccharimonadales bacterium]